MVADFSDQRSIVVPRQNSCALCNQQVRLSAFIIDSRHVRSRPARFGSYQTPFFIPQMSFVRKSGPAPATCSSETQEQTAPVKHVGSALLDRDSTIMGQLERLLADRYSRYRYWLASCRIPAVLEALVEGGRNSRPKANR